MFEQTESPLNSCHGIMLIHAAIPVVPDTQAYRPVAFRSL